VNRPLIIALIGIVVVGAALVLNLTLQQPSREELATTANAVKAIGPTFDVVRIDPKGNMVIAGRAAPGSVVAILDGETEIGRVTADARGEWVYLPTEVVKPGVRQFSLRQVAPDGSELLSENVVVMSVPERDGEVLIVEQSRDGGRSRVLQGPTAPAGTGMLTVETVDYDAEGKFTLSGKADPGATVQVYLDNEFIGRAVADDKGFWQIEPAAKATAGAHTVRADQLGPNNNVLARVGVPFSLTPEQLDVPPGAITVVRGNSLWRIARRIYGQGVQFTEIYEANKDQIKDPDMIYPGQVFTLPVKDRI
jgi:LysM repeat protein